jgi:hypothetical protein
MMWFYVLVAWLALSVTNASAKPAHRQAFADYFGPFLSQKLNNCQTCHLPDAADAAPDASDKPHNAFGARLKAARQQLRQDGKKTDIETRLQLILEEDTDGDGATNLVEILTGHTPGDDRDKPMAAELNALSQKLAGFRKYRSGYPWRPFETVRRPALPGVQNTAWVRNGIDAFVTVEHEARKLQPRPEAPRAVLLRRVYLDLIGLPPTPEELHAFVADESSDAYEKVVNRLLASPQYGERWGRHWMDVWRYSDWAGWGQQVRDSKPHIWHWRDWIIESLNEDKAYDRMIVEMLAGDELAPDDPDTLRATGYLVRNFKLLSREKWIQDTVDHTAQAFLGVTLGCARCHDHMYDSISQREYYQVRAVFEPHNVRTDRVPGELNLDKNGLPRAYDAELDVKTFLFLRGDERTPAKEPLPPGVPQLLGGKAFEPAPVSLSSFAHAPDKRPFVIEGLKRQSAARVDQARRSHDQETRKLVVSMATNLGSPTLAFRAIAFPYQESEVAASLSLAAAEASQAALLATLHVEAMEDEGKSNTEEWKAAARQALSAQRTATVLEAREKRAVTLRALQARKPGAKANPAAEKAAKDAEMALARAEQDVKKPLSTSYVKRPLPAYPSKSTGRRLAFARWIADRENPLTARVAVNHIWLRHFGQALVPSVFDFGRNGKAPSHPALLDWLASEFMDQGWSMKALHRLIVTSSTYRMASTPDPANQSIDSDNRYLWRMLPRRVEAEVVRDCVFFVSDRLDGTLGGPDIDYHEGLTRPRRSVYFRHAQEKQMEFLKLFDCAAVTECYQRKDSVLPQQALALANSELTIRNAQLLAHDLVERIGADPKEFTQRAFEQILSRPPTGEEMRTCLEFLGRQEDHYRSTGLSKGVTGKAGSAPSSQPALRARENLVHVLLNHHDFVTIR